MGGGYPMGGRHFGGGGTSIYGEFPIGDGVVGGFSMNSGRFGGTNVFGEFPLGNGGVGGFSMSSGCGGRRGNNFMGDMVTGMGLGVFTASLLSLTNRNQNQQYC